MCLSKGQNSKSITLNIDNALVIFRTSLYFFIRREISDVTLCNYLFNFSLFTSSTNVADAYCTQKKPVLKSYVTHNIKTNQFLPATCFQSLFKWFKLLFNKWNSYFTLRVNSNNHLRLCLVYSMVSPSRIKSSAAHAKKIILQSELSYFFILGPCPPAAGAGLCVRARFFPPLYLIVGWGGHFAAITFLVSSSGVGTDGFCLWNNFFLKIHFLFACSIL